jgi:hypothetical protein
VWAEISLTGGMFYYNGFLGIIHLSYAMMSDFTPRKLAEALAEKHTRFISEYSDEIEKMKQLSMLREKRDQLLHWVQENGSRDKYERELADTENELDQLRSSFQLKSEGHYQRLGDVVNEHKKARQYWLEKMGEIKS